MKRRHFLLCSLEGQAYHQNHRESNENEMRIIRSSTMETVATSHTIQGGTKSSRQMPYGISLGDGHAFCLSLGVSLYPLVFALYHCIKHCMLCLCLLSQTRLKHTDLLREPESSTRTVICAHFWSWGGCLCRCGRAPAFPQKMRSLNYLYRSLKVMQHMLLIGFFLM